MNSNIPFPCMISIYKVVFGVIDGDRILKSIQEGEEGVLVAKEEGGGTARKAWRAGMPAQVFFKEGTGHS